MLLVNDDATVAGFSGTEKQRGSLLFNLLDSISLVGIRTLSLPVSFFFLSERSSLFSNFASR